MRSRALIAVVLLGAVASARGEDVTISLSELEGTFGAQKGRYTAASQDIDFLAAAGLQDGGWVAPGNPIPLQIHMTISATPTVVREARPNYEGPRIVMAGGEWVEQEDGRFLLVDQVATYPGYLDPAEVLPGVTIAGLSSIRIEGTGDEHTIDEEVGLYTSGLPLLWLDGTLHVDLYDGASPLGILHEGTLYPRIDSYGSVTISDAYLIFDDSLLAGTPLPTEGADRLPEPTSLLLLAVLAPAVLRRKRRLNGEQRQ